MAATWGRVHELRNQMVSQAVPHSPERVAWTVLLSAFATFVVLTLTSVVGGNWWLRNASSNQVVTMVSSGTVLVTRPGRSAPEANLHDIPPGSAVATDSNANSILTFASADTGQVLASVQIFGDTQLLITQANSPRFFTGEHPHRISIQVTAGRIRSYVGVDVDRPVEVVIASEPAASTVLSVPGTNASVESTFAETIVTVREGQANVTAQDTTAVVLKDQRIEVTANSGPGDPLPADRNLLRNSDFAHEINGEWRVERAIPADPFDEPGTVEIVNIGGRRTVRFGRVGTRDWGRVGITQDINLNVQPYSSLRLHMDILVEQQDLWNCGRLGTECPLMVKIVYVDVYGDTHEWLQGFFYNYNDNTRVGSTFCVTCSPVQWHHTQWPFAKWQVFDSANLLETFVDNGAPAATLRSITLYGEGHQFISYATDIQLLASE
jgi:hypothetical protein